jgi:sterol desaturase/sphingolipid hydroxylase (fatty acid hydroxylase superfamily)
MLLLDRLEASVDLREIAAVVLIFVPLQLALPERPKQRIFRKQWFSDVLYLLLNGLFIAAGLGLLIGAALPWLQMLVPHGVADFIARQSLWIQVPAAFVIADIGYYLMHRAFHAVPFLWRFHAVHHSIEELDWLAAHRVHPVDQVLTGTASLLPVLMLGFSLKTMVIYGFLHLMQSHLVHANVRLNFGPLRYVFASPQFHHWHHANQVGAYDRNFSSRLIVLDYIGGTLNMPDAMPTRYGIDDHMPPAYPLQLVWPFVRWKKSPERQETAYGEARIIGRSTIDEGRSEEAVEANPRRV